MQNKKEAKGTTQRGGDSGERIFLRKSIEKPKLQFVDDVFGYVNLFPFLLRILPSDSPKLGIILKELNKTEVF